MSPFLQEIIGKNNDPGVLLAAFVFALVGHSIVLLGGTTLRDPKSQYSPEEWSFSYLMKDNKKRIIYVFLLIVVGLRFYPDFTGNQIGAFGGLLVGGGLDAIALLIKQKTKLLDPKQ